MLHERGTIEFRRSPGVRSAAEAKHWVAFVLRFVAHSMVIKDWDRVKLTNTYPTTTHLRSAIASGIQTLDLRCHGAIGLMKDVNEPATVVRPAEAAKINDQKKKKERKA